MVSTDLRLISKLMKPEQIYDTVDDENGDARVVEVGHGDDGMAENSVTLAMGIV